MQFEVSVVGVGYVGLQIGLSASEAGLKVCSIDTNQNHIASLNSGISPLGHIADSRVASYLKMGNLFRSTDESIYHSDAVIICVETPTDLNKYPDLRVLRDVVLNAAVRLRFGGLIVVESTVPPGTCDQLAEEIFVLHGKKVGVDFHLAHSPEREDPGRKDGYSFKNIPKLVSGASEICKQKAVALYQKLTCNVVPCSSMVVAELSKCYENSHRAVNIALANELKMLCDLLGVEAGDVISAASTKPFGFSTYRFGTGVGGHCIPVDPYFLTRLSSSSGLALKTLDAALQTNDDMPRYHANQIRKRLTEKTNTKSLDASRVLLLGMSYKANVADVRNSPSLLLMQELVASGVHVDYNDDLVSAVMSDGVKIFSLELASLDLTTYDLIVVGTLHDYYKTWLSEYLNGSLDFYWCGSR